MTLSARTGSFADDGGQDIVTATLTTPSGFATVVPLTFGGTAVYGTDYTAAGQYFNANTQALTIPAGQTSEAVVLTGQSDGEYGPVLRALVGVGPPGPPLAGSSLTELITNSSPPPQLIVNNIALSEKAGTANFTVILSEPSLLPVTVTYNTFDISAVAGVDYVSMSGTLTFAPGDTVKTIAVAVIDDGVYGPPSKLFGLQLNVNANATPSSTKVTAALLEAYPEPQVTVDDVSVIKPTSGQIQASFTVGLSAPSSLSTTVTYATSDITATAGTDFISSSGSITFVPGETTKIVPVTILGNSTPTGNLTFGFNLTSALNATISLTQAIGTIQDVNPAVGLSVADTSVQVAGPNTTQAVFTVTLQPAQLGQVVTVQYTTIDGTAVANRDYLPSQGILTFMPGVSSLTIPVTVLGATSPQPNSNFYLSLSNANPAGTTISISQASATIINTVVVPTISINNIQVPRGSSGTTPAIFTVSLSAPTEQTVSVNYTTMDGTAVVGLDYTAVSGTLTFLPGQTSLPIDVPVLGSTEYNIDSTFSVVLSSPTAGNLDSLKSVGTATIVNQVALPSINFLPVTATEEVLLNNVPLASLTAGSPSGPPVSPGTYIASIDWGDGTGSFPGQLVSQGSPAATLVLGSHRYVESGTYSVRITVGDSRIPAIVSATFQLMVAAVPIVLTGGLDPASDSGISHTDSITNVSQPIFYGTSEALSTVSV